jgi:hypothetical protein
MYINPKQIRTTPAMPATLTPAIAPLDNEGELEAVTVGTTDVDPVGIESASEVVTLDRKLDVAEGRGGAT